MAKTAALQTNFLGGEWSQTAQGRADLPAYKQALKTNINAVITETGAWTRRPGTKVGAHTRLGAPGRAVTFSFQENAPYTLEFTDGFLRFFAGDALVTTSDPQSVSAISSATPAVVQTSGAHGWITNQQFIFTALGTPDPQLLNRQFIGTVVDSTHISLVDAITGASLNGSLLAAFTTGTIAKIMELATPYGSGSWAALRAVQTEKKSILLQKTVAPQVLNVATDPAGSTYATFAVDPANFVDGPYLDPIAGMRLTPASVSGLVGCSFTFQTWSSTGVYSAGDYVTYSGLTYKSLVSLNLNNQPDTATAFWVAASATSPISPLGLQNTDIGRHVRIFSEPPDWVVGTTYGAGGSNTVKYNGTYWTSLVGSNTGNYPGVDITKWALNTAAAIWSWGKITSLSGATTSLISRTLGTAIGNMLSGGGLAGAFNGSTSQATGASAVDNTPGASSYIGKHYSAGAQAVAYGLYWSPNDQGVTTNGVPVIINLRASQTAPVSSSSGTLLGSSGTIPSFVVGPVQVNSNDTVTLWNYIWLEVIPQTGASGTSCAQAQFFNAVSTAGVGMTIQLLGPPLLYTSYATTWRLGLFSDTTGYPACGTFHEGRLWLSGAVNNRLDAGQPDGTLFNFAPTEADGTVTDSSAISYTLDGPDVNAVFWLVPDQQGIIIGTQAGEWLVQASALNSPLSALNMQAHRVTTIGCANIEPRRTEHTTIFAQKYKRKVMEYFADIFSGKFSAPNLSLMAAHLLKRNIAELAYQQELSPTIWIRCADGSLLSVNYKRDSLLSSQGPTYAAHGQHALGSSRVIESIAIGPSAANAAIGAGVLDTLAMVTNDSGSGIRHVEFLTQLFEEGSDETLAWFLDSGIVPVTAQGVLSGGVLGMNCVGLWPLNGKTVTVFCGGFNCGAFAVANGSCFVPYSNSGGTFNQSFATAASQTLVGFAYNSDGQKLRPISQEDSGARSGPALGKKSRTSQIAFLLLQSQGLQFGASFAASDLKAMNFGTPGPGVITPYPENTLFSGVYRNTIMGGDSYDNTPCWRASGPYPATIAAIETFLDSKDI